MKGKLEQWVNYLAAQLDEVIGADTNEEAMYHAGVYLRGANKLMGSRDVMKQDLGQEAMAGYFIALRNYEHMRMIHNEDRLTGLGFRKYDI